MEVAQIIPDVAGPSSWTGWTTAAVVSKDGRRVLFGSRDRMMIFCDLTTRRIIRRFVGHQAEVRSEPSSAPDGRRALSQDSNRVVRLWDIESGEHIYLVWRAFQPHLLGHVA